MEKHTVTFNNLKRNYNEIRVYNKGAGVNVNKFAQLFLFELINVNIQYQTFDKCLLSEGELSIVRVMVNRIIGNKNIDKEIRVKINKENLEFNEMIERIHNLSHNNKVDMIK